MCHILVDLDGTLANYNGDTSRIGEPVPAMAAKVKQWIRQGREVRIFTARASVPEMIPQVQGWLFYHGFGDLKVVNYKDFSTLDIYDDRAYRVEFNKGITLDKAI